MFEFLLACEDDAIGIMLQDHESLRDSFDRFETLEDRDEKYRTSRQVLLVLKIHALLEEEIFYPALQGSVEDIILRRAEEEHHVARMLVAQLEAMTGKEEQYEARFMVLADIMRHHIRGEERELLPRIRKTGLDLEALGQQLLARKESLMGEGVPALMEDAASQGAGHHDMPPRHAGKKARSVTQRKPVTPKRKAAKPGKRVKKTKRRPHLKPQLKIVASRSALPMEPMRGAAKKNGR